MPVLRYSSGMVLLTNLIPLYGVWRLVAAAFFLVMTPPFIADKSPNPMAGLIAVIVLKTLGELFGVWAARIAKV